MGAQHDANATTAKPVVRAHLPRSRGNQRRFSAVGLEYILRQIESDSGNLRHDRLPKWIVAIPPWHVDAVGGRLHHQRRVARDLSFGCRTGTRVDVVKKFRDAVEFCDVLTVLRMLS